TVALEDALPLDNSLRTIANLARIHLKSDVEHYGYQLLDRVSPDSFMDVRTAVGIADALMARHEWPRAIRFLEPHIEAHPDDYRLRYLYGVALEENLQNADARKIFIDLLTVDREVEYLDIEPFVLAEMTRAAEDKEWKSIRE